MIIRQTPGSHLCTSHDLHIRTCSTTSIKVNQNLQIYIKQFNHYFTHSLILLTGKIISTCMTIIYEHTWDSDHHFIGIPLALTLSSSALPGCNHLGSTGTRDLMYSLHTCSISCICWSLTCFVFSSMKHLLSSPIAKFLNKTICSL